MPSDVPMNVTADVVVDRPPRRIPVGVGLGIGAGASIALWTLIGMGLHALLS